MLVTAEFSCRLSPQCSSYFSRNFIRLTLNYLIELEERGLTKIIVVAIMSYLSVLQVELIRSNNNLIADTSMTIVLLSYDMATDKT